MIKLRIVRMDSDPLIPGILHYWTGKRWSPVPTDTITVSEYIDSDYLDKLGNKYRYTNEE